MSVEGKVRLPLLSRWWIGMSDLTGANRQAIRGLSPLVLAFVGDAVLELDVRSRAVKSLPGKIVDLHRLTVGHVQATAQAAAARLLLPRLTEDEQDVFRRAKNTRPIRVPKSASLADYRYSTGIEAVIGYLHLTEQVERLDFVLEQLWQSGESNQHSLEGEE